MGWTYSIQTDGKLMNNNVFIFLRWSWSLSNIKKKLPRQELLLFLICDYHTRAINNTQISIFWWSELQTILTSASFVHFFIFWVWWQHFSVMNLDLISILYSIDWLPKMAAVQRYDSCVRQMFVKPLGKKIKVTDPLGNFVVNGFLSPKVFQ